MGLAQQPYRIHDFLSDVVIGAKLFGIGIGQGIKSATRRAATI
jgi:hypothetical protein